MFKPNLLLLHGALGTSKELFRLKEYLSEHYTIYTFDFEGHGEAVSENDFSIELFTQNIRAFIQSHELENANIFGYSMGGYVALNYASLCRDNVNAIITYGTKFNWNPEFAANEVKKLNPDVIELKVPKFANHLKSIHHPSDWKSVVKKTAEMMYELGHCPNLTAEKLKALSTRTLVLLGELDNMVNQDESESVVSQLQNASLKILQGFVHPIERNDLHIMAEVIHDFIKN